MKGAFVILALLLTAQVLAQDEGAQAAFTQDPSAENFQALRAPTADDLAVLVTTNPGHEAAALEHTYKTNPDAAFAYLARPNIDLSQDSTARTFIEERLTNREVPNTADGKAIINKYCQYLNKASSCDVADAGAVRFAAGTTEFNGKLFFGDIGLNVRSAGAVNIATLPDGQLTFTSSTGGITDQLRLQTPNGHMFIAPDTYYEKKGVQTIIVNGGQLSLVGPAEVTLAATELNAGKLQHEYDPTLGTLIDFHNSGLNTATFENGALSAIQGMWTAHTPIGLFYNARDPTTDRPVAAEMTMTTSGDTTLVHAVNVNGGGMQTAPAVLGTSGGIDRWMTLGTYDATLGPGGLIAADLQPGSSTVLRQTVNEEREKHPGPGTYNQARYKVSAPQSSQLRIQIDSGQTTDLRTSIDDNTAVFAQDGVVVRGSGTQVEYTHDMKSLAMLEQHLGMRQALTTLTLDSPDAVAVLPYGTNDVNIKPMAEASDGQLAHVRGGGTESAVFEENGKAKLILNQPLRTNKYGALSSEDVDQAVHVTLYDQKDRPTSSLIARNWNVAYASYDNGYPEISLFTQDPAQANVRPYESLLRIPSSQPNFDTFNNFITKNPNWQDATTTLLARTDPQWSFLDDMALLQSINQMPAAAKQQVPFGTVGDMDDTIRQAFAGKESPLTDESLRAGMDKVVAQIRAAGYVVPQQDVTTMARKASLDLFAGQQQAKGLIPQNERTDATMAQSDADNDRAAYIDTVRKQVLKEWLVIVLNKH